MLSLPYLPIVFMSGTGDQSERVGSRVLCIGDILVDVVLTGAQLARAAEGYEFRYLAGTFLGGAAVNAAVAARRAGARATVWGVVGDDVFAKWVRDRLSAEDVEFCLETSSSPTGMVVTLVDGDEHRSIVGRGSADSLRLDDDRLRQLVRPGDFIHLNTFNLRFGDHRNSNVQTLQRFGSLEPRCRFSLDLNGADSTVRPLLESLPSLDVLFCTQAEIDSIFGRGIQHEQVKSLASIVAITRGERGVTLVQAHESVDIPAPVVNSLDSIGAGDCFAGTFLALLGTGVRPLLAAEEAVARASSSVTKHGPWEAKR